MTHARAKREFLEICRNMQLNPELIRSEDKHKQLVNFRRTIAKKLKEIQPPLFTSDIAHAMNRDHSSVRNLLKPRKPRASK